MPEATKVRVEVDLKSKEVIWVRGVIINPEQPAWEAVNSMPGLRYNDRQAADIPQEMWSGDEEERVHLAELGITNKAEVDIPVYYPCKYFLADDARKFLTDNNLGYGLPCFLTPLANKEIRKVLRAEGIWGVVAFGQSREKLWRVKGYPHEVFLRVSHGPLAFGTTPIDGWDDGDAAVGFPQISR